MYTTSSFSFIVSHPSTELGRRDSRDLEEENVALELQKKRNSARPGDGATKTVLCQGVSDTQLSMCDTVFRDRDDLPPVLP